MPDLLTVLNGPPKGEQLGLLIVLAGLVTYATRTAGHMILARFARIPARVEAGLEAVPAAVLVTIVVPPALSKGPLEVAALLVAVAASARLSSVSVIALGMIVVIAGRQFGL